jgi:hypothetical protein
MEFKGTRSAPGSSRLPEILRGAYNDLSNLGNRTESLRTAGRRAFSVNRGKIALLAAWVLLTAGSAARAGGPSEHSNNGVTHVSANASSNGHVPVTNGVNPVILVAGGDIGGNLFHYLDSALFVTSTDAAQVYVPSQGRFNVTPPLNESREMATATRLPNGKILIAGGVKCANTYLGPRCKALHSAELYDPSTGSFTRAGAGSGYKMASARSGHTATLIQGCNCAADGKVLLAGGVDDRIATIPKGIITTPPVKTAEIYDPVTDSFIALPAKMGYARVFHAAKLINGGKVLIVGGDDGGFFEHALASAEIYEPKTGKFVPAGVMAMPREFAKVTVFDPKVVKGPLAGKVLITGGVVASGRMRGDSTDTAELFDPASRSFTMVESRMSSPRAGHSATLLRSGPLAGKVLVVGGISTVGNGTALGTKQHSEQTADLYDPSAGPTGRFRPTGKLREGRAGHVAAVLLDGVNAGQVLVAGGENCNGKAPSACYVAGSSADKAAGNPGVGCELYDPATETWRELHNAMPTHVNGASGYGTLLF